MFPRTIQQSSFKILSHRSIQRFRMSSSISSSQSPAAAGTNPIIELREYELIPSQVPLYTTSTTKASDLRKSLTPLRLFTMPETGGQLNVATHLYYYNGGFEERNERRAGMGSSLEWKEYLNHARTCMVSQKSTIFVEAPLVSKTEGVCGLKPGSAESQLNMLAQDGSVIDQDCIYEIRRYQLKLGYDTVPKFLKLYEDGLPSKLIAPGTDPTTSLVTLLYSEVGQLNEVIEIWRHGSMSAMEQSRVASRSAKEWRKAIAEIANLANVFTSTIHKPLSFSPLL
mmetsp:Transcript_17044/g.20812  ORF Transcript_17044/g.20812 Transcript_17044/m.20812 type:complete len:283 (+) Transcript_17044:137-985(+)